MKIKLINCLISLLFSISLFSQNIKSVSINGYIQDSETGETLIGCHIMDSATNRGATSNAFGFFSMAQNAGDAVLTVHYLGYHPQTVRMNLTKDTALNILLQPKPFDIGEVVIQGSKTPDAKLSQPQMSVINLNSREIRSMPALLGESDVMRAVQVMPGIQAANERSSGISVRGGSIDQNLFLLDDAPVFQISHMMGFYSVFNNDAVKDIRIYKGDIPANYGGRVSSVVDIRLKDGNMQKFSMSGGIGPAAANLTVEGPVVKERVSLIASGKYAYIGWLYQLLEPIKMTFYDMNFKLNAVVNRKNRIYLSSYNGGDNDGIQRSKYKNNTLSLRWNHVYHPRLFSNISFIYSNYRLKSESAGSSDYRSLSWTSGIRQATLKAEFNHFINNKNTLDFGASATYAHFVPGKLEGSREAKDHATQSVPFSNRIVEEQGVLDYALYVSNLQKPTDRFSLRYGVRASLYQNLGGHWVYRLGDDYLLADSFYVEKNRTYAGYFNIEPRVSLNFRASKNSAVKAGYSFTVQQTQLLMKTNGGGPLDIWFPSGANIRPQTSSQYSLGWVQYLFGNSLEASVEGYYKDMNHIIDYKDGATLVNKGTAYNPATGSYHFEEQLRTGKGSAYGIELTVKGYFGAADGFVNYTYARSKRKIPGINDGTVYLSPFDKPHTFDLFLNYSAGKRVSFSANLRLQSGQVTTMPVYVMEMYGKAMTGYSNRNEYRLPYYQRLDLSLTLKNREKPGKRRRSEWNFSVINVLNHANLYYIKFTPSEENPGTIHATGVYMLGILPSVSWNFKF
ncbi:MAG: TonB-dependent receptor [Bacteroidales bacterium]|jgi:outer membrane receptor for ferrienterochelin and colicin|nr:TonB-dependent receptor [Bacteroidales bacterium]